MKTKTEIYANRFGLEFSIEMVFAEKDDHGNIVNQWCVDEYSVAKMILYKDAIVLLPLDKETVEVSKILSVGVSHFLNQLL